MVGRDEGIAIEWERIGYMTWRLRVFAGWLVRMDGNSPTFVPDRFHEWIPNEIDEPRREKI